MPAHRIISRAEWGAQPPKGSFTAWPAGGPTSWTIHYEGSDVPIDKADYEANVRGIQAYHLHHPTENYVDIAYNLVVAPNGDIFEGRGLNVRSGAQASGNISSIAVCYIGGPNTPLTAAAQNSINWIIALKPLTVYPHHHWIATSCPGANVEAWLNLGRPDGQACQCPPEPPQPPAPAEPFPLMFAKAIAFLKVAILRRSIQKGDTGQGVWVVQLELHAKGFYTGTVDKSFGPMTFAAVVAFQKAFGLTVDGVVGPQTFGALTA